MNWKRLLSLAVAVGFCLPTLHADEPANRPIPIIFDTDIGNDCDDVLALAMIHSLQSRGDCELLAVTITKDHELAAPFTDCLNTFYGRGDIPIGVCRSGVTPDAGKFNVLASAQDDGQVRYPHDLKSGKTAPSAVSVLRKALADAEDGSVAICQVGFSTNLAELLKSPADDVSPLTGVELVKQKVHVLSIMAGSFGTIPGKSPEQSRRFGEYNIKKDIPAAQSLVADWPTPIVWSGYEIGMQLRYPYKSIQRDYDYVKHHPVSEAYDLYIKPPHNRPTWDLTSVLYAVRPDYGYFDLSEPGRVTVNDDSTVTFEPQKNGRDRYLILSDKQHPRAEEALILLSSEPPHHMSSYTPNER
ncbi:MAG: nucleoside hydrolase [Blastopirellula sp. JB062]